MHMNVYYRKTTIISRRGLHVCRVGLLGQIPRSLSLRTCKHEPLGIYLTHRNLKAAPVGYASGAEYDGTTHRRRFGLRAKCVLLVIYVYRFLLSYGSSIARSCRRHGLTENRQHQQQHVHFYLRLFFHSLSRWGAPVRQRGQLIKLVAYDATYPIFTIMWYT